jgi:ribosomal protein L11 methyltransferase
VGSVLIELGETAFESFTETETGVSAFVQKNYGTEQFLRTYVY